MTLQIGAKRSVSQSCKGNNNVTDAVREKFSSFISQYFCKSHRRALLKEDQNTIVDKIVSMLEVVVLNCLTVKNDQH